MQTPGNKREAVRMTLCEPRGDNEEEELEGLGIKCGEGVIEVATWPFVPFLLTTLLKGGGKRQFVIDKWEGSTLDIDKTNQFTQTFTWIGHKASEEEIEKFLEEERE